ncbi:acyl-CoA N-acyltransferase [Lipomyces kononenkoae]|uniref:Acyl-CoA N-acyltransferase n=1 Tax=Lipomyces kononenkoae TaxID=34357 RepID=A0ACC3T856_LIPKO
MSTSTIRPEEWTADANRAVTISLVRHDGTTVGSGFHPQFTYPIFGEAEVIYGFKDLDIELKFGSTDLVPYLKVSYSDILEDKEDLARVIENNKKQKRQDDETGDGNELDGQDDQHNGDEEQDGDNPDTTLRGFLPKDLFTEENQWLEKVKDAARTFTPPGELVGSYNYNNLTFEIWRAPISDEKQRVLHERMQIFVLFFIEGGSYIDSADDRWRIYTLYEKSADGVYTFAGFTTVYSYLWYKNAEVYDSSTRLAAESDDDFFNLYQRKRISQFVILPPFQGQKHGPKLYNTLMDEFYKDALVKEVTVEDPNVAFDDMRDRCDMERLDKYGIWNDDGFTDAPVSKEWIRFAQAKTKIIPRQFQRVMEMALLRRLKNSDRNEYRNYRLQVKQRLFKHNKEALKDLDKSERIEKIDEAYRSVEEDYYRLLNSVPVPEYIPEQADVAQEPVPEVELVSEPVIKDKGKRKHVQFDLSQDEEDLVKRGRTE